VPNKKKKNPARKALSLNANKKAYKFGTIKKVKFGSSDLDGPQGILAY
jgi:hypothetical protein